MSSRDLSNNEMDRAVELAEADTAAALQRRQQKKRKEQDLNWQLNLVRDRIEQISALTAQMAVAHAADSDNPRFNSVMNDFHRMVEISDQIVKALEALATDHT